MGEKMYIHSNRKNLDRYLRKQEQKQKPSKDKKPETKEEPKGKTPKSQGPTTFTDATARKYDD